jgi:hypothetical protein
MRRASSVLAMSHARELAIEGGTAWLILCFV